MYSKLYKKAYPIHTRRHFNVYTTSSQPYGRCIDVKTTLCARTGYDLKRAFNKPFSYA